MSICLFEKETAYSTLFICLLILSFSLHVQKMPPSIEKSAIEPIKYIGEQQTDPNYHHGGLRHGVGIWKHQMTALSADDGKTWTDFVLSKSLMTCGVKTWGQRTEDGK